MAITIQLYLVYTANHHTMPISTYKVELIHYCLKTYDSTKADLATRLLDLLQSLDEIPEPRASTHCVGGKNPHSVERWVAIPFIGYPSTHYLVLLQLYWRERQRERERKRETKRERWG